MTLSEATSMLPGLQSAVEKVEAALKSGAKCPDVTAEDLATARIFRDHMTQFVAAGVNGSILTVQKPWLDAAGKAVQCAIQAEAAAPNTGAYVALGAIVMGGIVAFSI
jgi:malate synthase